MNSGNFENNLNLLSVIIQHTHAIIILSIILFVHKTNQTKSNPQFAVCCNLFGRKISSVSRKCIEQCYYNHVLPNELDTCDWCWCEQQLCRNKAQNRNFSVFLLKFISTMASSMLFAASPFILKHGDSYQQSNVNAMQITDMWWKQKFFLHVIFVSNILTFPNDQMNISNVTPHRKICNNNLHTPFHLHTTQVFYHWDIFNFTFFGKNSEHKKVE